VQGGVTRPDNCFERCLQIKHVDPTRALQAMLKRILFLSLGLLLNACAQTGDTSKVVPMDLKANTWHLVEIASMDDTVYRPKENATYSLTFMPTGDVAVVADCNRGRGSWLSAQAGQLTITQLATTRAMCVPTSIADRFTKDLTDVRSYVFRDGHLYLATKADGAILEFQSKIDSNVMPSIE
jgi:heat shock protein HslJ